MFLVDEPSMPGNWRKSSYSGQDGSCVEAGSGGGAVFVRDTADREGPALRLPAASWNEFLAALRG